MTADKGMIAGMYHAQIATRDSNGYPVGQNTTPDTKTPGSTYNAYKIVGIVEVSAPEPTVEVAKRYAAQTIKGQRALGVSDFGTFTVTLSDYDETFNNLIGGSAVDVTTMTGWDAITSGNFRRADRPQLYLLLSMGFQRDDGTNQFITFVYDNVQIIPQLPRASQSGGVNPNALTYTVTPSTSNRSVMGRLYSAMALLLAENADVGISIRYAKPMGLTTFIKNAAATTFTLGFKPTSSDVTGNVTNSITNNGTTLAVTSVSTVTGLVTLTAAGVSGDIVAVVYPTDYL